jgi:hypothetical protein
MRLKANMYVGKKEVKVRANMQIKLESNKKETPKAAWEVF